jgi:hypothetical protein
MRMRCSILVLALALAVQKVHAAELTPKEKFAAQKLYQAKCSKCHHTYDPNDYPDEEWKLWLLKMGKKAKLKPGQQDLISRYLDAQRVQKTATKSQ